MGWRRSFRRGDRKALTPTTGPQVPRMMYLIEGEKLITLRICIIYLARDTLATRKVMEEFLHGYC